MVIWYISKYASPQKYFFGTRHFYLAEEWVKKEHEVCVFTSNSSHLTDQLPVFNDKKDKACYLFSFQASNGPFREFVFVEKQANQNLIVNSLFNGKTFRIGVPLCSPMVPHLN